eukprot:4634187-Amphidinium_carterae.1
MRQLVIEHAFLSTSCNTPVLFVLSLHTHNPFRLEPNSTERDHVLRFTIWFTTWYAANGDVYNGVDVFGANWQFC